MGTASLMLSQMIPCDGIRILPCKGGLMSHRCTYDLVGTPHGHYQRPNDSQGCLSCPTRNCADREGALRALPKVTACLGEAWPLGRCSLGSNMGPLELLAWGQICSRG